MDLFFFQYIYHLLCVVGHCLPWLIRRRTPSQCLYFRVLYINWSN